MKITGWLIETTRLRIWDSYTSVQCFTNLDLPVLQKQSWIVVMTQMVNGRLRHFTRYNIRTDRQESGENKLILVGDQRQRK